MHTINKILLLPVFLGALLFLSCTTASAPKGPYSGLSAKANELIQQAVFEVVIKKPAADPLRYDKPLDFSVIPYAVRTDDYYSIGTAFAISPTEFMTAFHVINLGDISAVYDTYYIRDGNGKIFEIDQVTQASNERDFIVCTAKGASFAKFFTLQSQAPVGTPVYSVGNALGEGIIVRNGLILGTLPEEEEGRWLRLKSSADGNPGNSGGPLITPDGKVVGVVTSLKDNILYSIPSSEILTVDRSNFKFRRKYTYGHLVLPGRLSHAFILELPLPGNAKAIQKHITDSYKPVYAEQMRALFAQESPYLGDNNSGYLTNSVFNYSFPEIAFLDRTDVQWKVSDLKVDRYNLRGNGNIVNASVSGFNFIRMQYPDNTDFDAMLAKPEALMELILQGISFDRELGSSKYRILSFGTPSSVGEYRDSLGRLWLSAKWPVAFEDKELLFQALPLPDGIAVIMIIVSSTESNAYEWDLLEICNKTMIAYNGSFTDWQNFLGMRHWVPQLFSDFSFTWDESQKTVAVRLPEFSASFNGEILDWTNDSELLISPAYYRSNGEIGYGVRRAFFQRNAKGKDYLILYKNTVPDQILGPKSLQNWEALTRSEHPFNQRPAVSASDNLGTIGGVLTPTVPVEDVRFTLFMSMENPESETALAERYQKAFSNITVQPAAQ